MAWMSAIFAFILYLIVHISIFRAFQPKERFRTLKTLFFSFLPVVFVGSALLPLALSESVLNIESFPFISGSTLEYLNAIGLSIFLFFGYCTFYSLVDRSVSVRVHTELTQIKNQPLTFKKLLAHYQPNQATERRFSHMIDRGYLEKRDDRFYLTQKGGVLATRVSALKKFLNLGIGG